MGQRFIILAIFLFCIGLGNAQVFNPSADKIYQSLLGDVHLLTLFVDTEDDYWEEDEMQYYRDELLKSQDWLIDQAYEYEQELEFLNETFSENYELIYIRRVSRGNPKGLIQLVMLEIDYENIDDFFEENRFDFAKEKFKIMLLVKNNSRSHAYNLWSKNDVDIAIVYCTGTYGLKTDQYVISHEMLHQFGAWDLYMGESQSEEKAAKALELYPHSVMINTYSNKAQLEVDELTAWLIGWHTNFKERYNDFIPVREKR